MISGIHTTKPRTQRYVDAFVQGTPGGKKIYQFRDLKKLPNEELTMYGILAGSGEVYKWCERENKTFYFRTLRFRDFIFPKHKSWECTCFRKIFKPSNWNLAK